MKTLLKHHINLHTVLLLAWLLLSACGLLSGDEIPPATSEPVPAQAAAASPQAPGPPSPAGQSPQPAPAVPAGPAAAPLPTSSVPAVVGTFPVQTILPPQGGNKGGGMGALLTLPGQVWTGSMFGGLQQWDPQTGQVIRVLSNIPSKVFLDLEYDGEKMWVLANDSMAGITPDALYVISLPDGQVVKRFDLEPHDTLTQVGVSPGKVWVHSTIYDTSTLQFAEVEAGLPIECQYAWDGGQWMWITGSHCQHCGHDLWIYDANDLPAHKDAQNSGTKNDGVLDSRLLLAGGKIWLVVRPGGEPDYKLDAYDLHKTDQPALQVDLKKEFQETDTQASQAYLATDSRVLWLSLNGRLYYLDMNDGKILGSLPMGGHVMGMGFDGRSLWVLSNDDGLVQVSVPWAQ